VSVERGSRRACLGLQGSRHAARHSQVLECPFRLPAHPSIHPRAHHLVAAAGLCGT